MAKPFGVLASGLLALTAGHVPGTAQQAPANLRPTRDVVVDITTTVQGPGRTETIAGRAAWLVAEDLVRIETQGVPGWTLLDRKRGRAVMVMDDRRAVVPLPPAMAALVLREVPSDVPFSRQGTDAVAGHDCVDWRVALPHGDSVICLTADGVMLRWAPAVQNSVAPGTSMSKVEATAISYRAQDPARFRIPPGYAVLDLPRFETPGAAPPR